MKTTKHKFLIFILLILTILVTGCEDKKDNNIISNGEKVSTSEMKHLHCTRKATASSDMKVSLNYDIYYKGENISILHAEDKVTSNNKENLDSYENSYNTIKSNYEGLNYYDQTVTRDENSVTNDITINYDKIDTDKLLEIEGEEDNIIVDKKAKLNKWLTLAKKVGTTCKEVEE